MFFAIVEKVSDSLVSTPLPVIACAINFFPLLALVKTSFIACTRLSLFMVCKFSKLPLLVFIVFSSVLIVGIELSLSFWSCVKPSPVPPFLAIKSKNISFLDLGTGRSVISLLAIAFKNFSCLLFGLGRLNFMFFSSINLFFLIHKQIKY